MKKREKKPYTRLYTYSFLHPIQPRNSGLLAPLSAFFSFFMFHSLILEIYFLSTKLTLCPQLFSQFGFPASSLFPLNLLLLFGFLLFLLLLLLLFIPDFLPYFLLLLFFLSGFLPLLFSLPDFLLHDLLRSPASSPRPPRRLPPPPLPLLNLMRKPRRLWSYDSSLKTQSLTYGS